jgi:hypothetical protein
MTFLPAAALALLLAADPTPAPVPETPPAAAPAPDLTPQPILVQPRSAPEASAGAVAVAAPAPSTSSVGRLVRAGLGVSVTDADAGYASTFQAGVQVDPWNLVGFRGSIGMTTSVFGAGGWDSAELTTSVLLRPIGSQRRVVPYAGLGVQFAFLAIFPDAPADGSGTVPKVASGHLAPLATAAPGESVDQAKGGFGGTNQFKIMPELTVGALFKLTDRLDLDVAGRYLPLSWNGTTYDGFSVVASICAPF